MALTFQEVLDLIGGMPLCAREDSRGRVDAYHWKARREVMNEPLVVVDTYARERVPEGQDLLALHNASYVCVHSSVEMQLLLC